MWGFMLEMAATSIFVFVFQNVEKRIAFSTHLKKESLYEYGKDT